MLFRSLSISRFVGTRMTGTAQIYFFFFFLFFLPVGRMSSVIGYVLDFPFCGNLVERHRISCFKMIFSLSYLSAYYIDHQFESSQVLDYLGAFSFMPLSSFADY